MKDINNSLNIVEKLVGDLPADVSRQTFDKAALLEQLKALQEAVAAATAIVESK